MPTADSHTFLQAGISALKAGERAQAREWLLQAVDADETDEVAWLWLSGAVESPDDRRICLENVLALNPDNETARRGLAKLEPTPELTAVAPPAAPIVTYAQEWIGLSHTSRYDDVWERSGDLCAYCAQKITPQDKTCPRCGRKLLISSYRYEEPDTTLHILWVALAGIAQLYLVQALYDVIVRQSMLAAALPVSLMVLFLVFTAGVYFRQFWAYVGALVTLCLILLVNVLGFFIPAELTNNLLSVGPMFDNVVNPVVSGLADFLRYFQLAAVVLALIVAALKAGPNFERVQHRQVAALQKGIRDAGSYHGVATRAAKRGEWATAVLHWQRAAANAPGQISFQRHLGSAYARLGFYQRSADVLQAALPRVSDPAQKAQLQRLLDAVQQQLDIIPVKQEDTNHG
ncbi:MAG: hypothetical protein IPM39_14005 [Chloroflexi bacterium]|nr:hypothetical protein [Chloroflexota bacterium]